MRRLQLIDLGSMTVVVGFIVVINLAPGPARRWQSAPDSVRYVIGTIYVVLSMLHLVFGPFQGKEDSLDELKHFKRQIINNACRAAVAASALLWIFGFNEVLSWILSTALQLKPRVAAGLSYLASLTISGIIGNLAYDLLKKFLRMSISLKGTAHKLPDNVRAASKRGA
jgi:hypothetical protein